MNIYWYFLAIFVNDILICYLNVFEMSGAVFRLSVVFDVKLFFIKFAFTFPLSFSQNIYAYCFRIRRLNAGYAWNIHRDVNKYNSGH